MSTHSNPIYGSVYVERLRPGSKVRCGCGDNTPRVSPHYATHTIQARHCSHTAHCCERGLASMIDRVIEYSP